MTKKAVVVGLDGQPIKQSRKTSRRDPITAKILKAAQENNNNGNIGAILVITVSPSGVPSQMFHWGDAEDMFASMIGAMEISKQSLIGMVLDGSDTEVITGED